MKGVKVSDDFWDVYAERLNDYHTMIISNYESGRISLKEKCHSHENVSEFFEDFYLQHARLY
jgi:hypothetical protein